MEKGSSIKTKRKSKGLGVLAGLVKEWFPTFLRKFQRKCREPRKCKLGNVGKNSWVLLHFLYIVGVFQAGAQAAGLGARMDNQGWIKARMDKEKRCRLHH